MIWGHDNSMQILVNLVILVVILTIHFIRRYMKRKKHQNEDEITKSQTKNEISTGRTDTKTDL